MKRIFSILLLSIFLLNVGGFYMLFTVMQYQAQYQLGTRLDNGEYNEQETFLFKIPLTLAYPISQNGYERVQGKFEHGGEFYQLVKQKMENDTLFVVCIKDKKSKALDQTMTDLGKLSSDGSTSKGIHLLSKLLKDFNSSTALEITDSKRWERDILHGNYLASLTIGETSLTTPPPKAFCLANY